MTDICLKKISEQYGTPAFVFDVDMLQTRLQSIKEIIGETIHLCYAIKANPFLIEANLTQVDNLEVCSPGEFAICKKLHVDMSTVILSGVNKTSEDIADALDHHVGLYTAESQLHVDLLNAAGKSRNQVLPVLLRLTSGSQFGMDESVLRNVIANRGDYPFLSIEGIHYFVGTQRHKIAEQQKELAELQLFCESVQSDYNFKIKKLEYGPGLAVPYFTCDNFEDTLYPLKELAPQLQELAKSVHLTIEMGRFIVAECGYYMMTVMDTKTNKEVHYCIVDGGINHVNYFGQLMGMKIPVIEQISKATCVEMQEKIWTICGSLCSTGDILTRKIKFDHLSIGDTLAFCNMGAYSVTEGIYLFLSRKMPRIILYKQGEISLVRDFFATDILNTKGEL